MKISSEYRHSLLFPAILIVVYLSGIAIVALPRPCWRDECHFVETIVRFENDFSISTLLHYNEMSTPLPFMLYAAWGKVAGDSLFDLRMFSLLVACAAFFTFHYLFFLVTRRRMISFLFVAFLACNPYMAGASIFVFTDMLMMLSLALFMIGMVRRNFWLLLFSSVAGLLCRQYFVFAVGAGVLYFILAWINEKKGIRPLVSAGILLSSMIPLLLLFALWHGVSPDNIDRRLNLRGGPPFHINSLVLYITLITVYAFPLVVAFRKYFYRKRALLLYSLPFGLVYWFFPITPSAPAIDRNVATVGFFHRLLQLWPGGGREHYLFFALFTLALPVCLRIGLDLAERIIRRKTGLQVFLGLAFFSFLAVMPFSYMHWEKYFLPLLPILALYGAIAQSPEKPDSIQA